MTKTILVKERLVIPNVIKVKNGIPTVIEWDGQRYVLDHYNQYKQGVKKSFKNIKIIPK
jgi:hypothetical protein